MEFLQLVVPPTVFSSGSGRRRRRGENPLPDGRRSDQGFLVFYRQLNPQAEPKLKALKAPGRIRAYLEAQLSAPLAEHWCGFQLTQYRAAGDGKTMESGFTAGSGRHHLGFVLDLDGGRMDPMYQRMLKEDWWAFLEVVERRLAALGVETYRLVRSSPVGAHLYLPVLRPDGRPVRATDENKGHWDRAAAGLHRYFEDLGADANAVKVTQPFVIPGLPRLKWPGFVPYLAAHQDGARTDLFGLIRRLSALKQIPRRELAPVIPLPSVEAHDEVQQILEDVRCHAAGLAEHDGRNQAAHDLAVYLLCKGATEQEMREALTTWNRRNAPSLSERELERCIRSAERRSANHDREWSEMQRAPWLRLRALLGLPAPKMIGYTRNGKYRPITPRRSWEERKSGGGREHYEEVAERVLRFVAGEGGRVEMTQAEIVNTVDTNRTTLRAVLEALAASGRLMVTTRRGRSGKTILELPTAPDTVSSQVTENDSSRISPEGVQMGAWVGTTALLTVADAGDGRCQAVGSPSDPLAAVCAVLLGRTGVDLRSYRPLPVVAVSAGGEAGWRLVARDWLGRDILAAMVAMGALVDLRRLLGVPVVVEPIDSGS
jgi:hypothetical protein